MSYDDIAEILKIISGSSCDELIVETGDLKLVVRRNGAGTAYSPSHNIVAPAANPTRVAAAAQAAGATRSQATASAPRQIEVKAPASAPGQIEVTAPMVGTFYRAPSPDARPFVEIGQTVRKGDPLCLIEVMKLFTTIASEHDGRIAQISAETGELVEYGRTLFVIAPA